MILNAFSADFDYFKGPFSESPDRYGSQGALTLTIMFSGGAREASGCCGPVRSVSSTSLILTL